MGKWLKLNPRGQAGVSLARNKKDVLGLCKMLKKGTAWEAGLGDVKIGDRSALSVELKRPFIVGDFQAELSSGFLLSLLEIHPKPLSRRKSAFTCFRAQDTPIPQPQDADKTQARIWLDNLSRPGALPTPTRMASKGSVS